MAKIGRPLKNPPKDAAEHIRAFAADGFSVIGVAAKLGTSQDTMRKWFDRFPELSRAFEQGREDERHMLHNKLFRLATEKDNAAAAMFLLKARHGYREGDQSEQGNRVSINFTLPGALPLDQFKGQIIDHTKGNLE